MSDDEEELFCDNCGSPYGSSWDSCPHCAIDAEKEAQACPSFTQKKMCKSCPFRKNSAGGWLGDYSPSDVIDTIRAEVPFYCHNKIDYDDPSWRAKLDGKPHCAGALQMAKRMCKSPRDKDHAKAVKDIVIQKNHIESPKDFLDHHKL